MKKRMIAALLTMSMVLSVFAGCGGKEETNTSNDSSTTTETSTTVNTEVSTEDLSVENTEIVETEVAEEDTEFTVEKGMQKIQRLYDAHTVLLNQNKQLENDTQRCVESLDFSNFDNSNAITADGLIVENASTIKVMLINYYDNYVNKNGEYYDFKEWLSKQENAYSIASKYYTEEQTTQTNDILFMEAIGLIAYMKSCESVNPVEIIETTEYTVSDRQSAYVITLACNGENELYAVYDAEGNLLNIWPIAEDWNKYISSFPEVTAE